MNKTNYHKITSFIFILSMLLEIIDTTILNIALPKFKLYFHVNMTTLSWICNSYILTIPAMIPIGSWFGEKYGSKKIFSFSILIFTFSSAFCGMSNNIQFLILGRIFQGVGAGMSIPVIQTIMLRSLKPSEIPKILASISSILILFPALSQFFGGYILEYFSWRIIFYINIPIGLFLFIFSLKYLQEEKKTKNSIDIIGILLSIITITLFFYSITLFNMNDNKKNVIIFIISIICGVIFILYELKNKSPFINMKIFSSLKFSSSILCFLLIYSPYFGLFYISNFIFQETIGWSPFQTGILSIPLCVGMLFATKLFSLLLEYSQLKILIYSIILIIITNICLIFITSKDQYLQLFILNFFRGVGIGFPTIILQTISLSNLDKDRMSDASTILSITKYSIMSLGIGLFTLIINLFMKYFNIYPITFTGHKMQMLIIFRSIIIIDILLCIVSIILSVNFRNKVSTNKFKLKLNNFLKGDSMNSS